VGWNKLVGVEPEHITDILASGQVAFGATRRPNAPGSQLTTGA
jgi:hypothetical protein